MAERRIGRDLVAEHAAHARDGGARAEVLRADVEPHPVAEAERMREQQPLHLVVVGAAPAATREEGVADGDRTLRGPVVVETRRADDLAGGRITHHQRTAGRKTAVEDRPEDLGLVAVPGRVLLPDERILRDLVERVMVTRLHRREMHEVADERRLQQGRVHRGVKRKTMR